MLSLDEVVDQLYSVSQSVQDMFGYLFSRAWELLNEDAKLILKVTSLFVGSVERKSLGKVCCLSERKLNEALTQLNDMSLVEEDKSSLGNRIGTHPLSRAFAYAQLLATPEQEGEIREEWVEWALITAKQIHAEDQRELFKSEIDNLIQVLTWLEKKNRIREFTQLYEQIQARLYSDGHWNIIIDSAGTIARWAVRTNDSSVMPIVLASSVDALDKLGLHRKAYEWLQEIFKNIPAQNDLVQAEFWLAEARLLYRMSQFVEGQRFEASRDNLLRALQIFHSHGDQGRVVWTLNTLGHLHRQQGLFEDATQFYREGLGRVSEHKELLKYWYGILRGGIAIVRGRQGHFQESFQLISEAFPHLDDQADQAVAYVVMAYLKLKLGDISEAKNYRQQADNLITRLGIARPFYWEDEEWERLYSHSPTNREHDIVHGTLK